MASSGAITLHDIQVSPWYIVAAVIVIVLGILLLLAGRRMVRPTLFVAAMLLVFAIVLQFWQAVAIMLPETARPPPDSPVPPVVALVVGAIAGLLAAWLRRVGLFALGATAGYFIAIWLLALFVSSSIIVAVRYAIMAAVLIVCGLLLVFLERFLFTVCAAFLGAFMLLVGIDMLLRLGFSARVICTLMPLLACSAADDSAALERPAVLYTIVALVAIVATLALVLQVYVTRRWRRWQRGRHASKSAPPRSPPAETKTKSSKRKEKAGNASA